MPTSDCGEPGCNGKVNRPAARPSKRKKGEPPEPEGLAECDAPAAHAHYYDKDNESIPMRR